MKFRVLSIFVVAILFAVPSNAKELPQQRSRSIPSVISAYRYYKDVDNLSINVPTVVEVPFANEFIERFDFAVLNKITNSFEPHFFRQEVFVNKVPVSASVNPPNGRARYMVDDNASTYAEFDLPENAQGYVAPPSTQGRTQITLTAAYPITSSALITLLDNYVALPSTIEIRALVDGRDKIVVANRRMDQPTVRFPQTISNRWTITYTYGQPLRITELRLVQEDADKTSARALRFLAQPGHSYRVYFDPDRPDKPPVGEAGNLSISEGVLTISDTVAKSNPSYIMADVDNDSVPDLRDNCVSVANSDQEDINNNNRGDACEDFDKDSVMNNKDNCPNLPNRDQRDTDGDGLGDVCDKEESRITERYPWIPWIGIGFAALVLIVLFALTVRSAKSETP